MECGEEEEGMGDELAGGEMVHRKGAMESQVKVV